MIFVERGIDVIISVRCMWLRACVVRSSGFVRAITSTLMHEFQNNLAQLFFFRSRNAFETLPFSGKTSGTSVLIQGVEYGFVNVPLHNIYLSSDVNGQVAVGIRQTLRFQGVHL